MLPNRKQPGRVIVRATVPRALLALAAALALLHLALPLAALPQLVARNYNEGWNAYHADAVGSERPLYPEPAALFPNNYPPLSFPVVAFTGRVIGDPLRAGRMLSLLAFLVVSAEIAWLALRYTGSLGLGAFAGLLFAAYMGAAFDDYVAMNDPQLLAHALMLGGLGIVSGGRSPGRLFAAALLMTLGGLAKHNLIALPLAVTAWLFGRDRRAFGSWLAAAALVAAAALAALFCLFGSSVFASVLGPRTISLEIAAWVSAGWLASLAAPLAIGLLGAREAWCDADGRLLALYAALSLVLGFAASAGEGVSYNAYFDLLIALSLLGPFLISRVAVLVPTGVRVIPLGALALALLLGPLIEAPDALLRLPARLDENARLEAATREDVAYLAAREGPAVCETLALCFWAGKPAGVDLFNSQQLFRSGRADEDALFERVAEGAFGTVQLVGLPANRDDERVSGQLARALQLHYVTDRVSANGVFLRPRHGTREH
jgi:hypothetical protein